MSTVERIAMALIVLTGAGLLLRNTGGVSDLVNTTFSGFQKILSLGSGAPVASGSTSLFPPKTSGAYK